VYIAALKTQARALDAELEGADPDVVALRGRRPLVLTPIANPANAEALVSVAHALAPPHVGGARDAPARRAPARGRAGQRWARARPPPPCTGRRTDATARATGRPAPTAAPPDLATAQRVLGASLEAALGMGLTPQALTTLADDPWDEIARVARTLDCEGLLVGLSDLHDEATLARLDELLGRVRSDVVVLRAPEGWHLERCRKVVVPFAGRADQERLRARVLASLSRLANPRSRSCGCCPRTSARRPAAARSVSWSAGRGARPGQGALHRRTDRRPRRRADPPGGGRRPAGAGATQARRQRSRPRGLRGGGGRRHAGHVRRHADPRAELNPDAC
jgi:basic amino acid/polyamine antiporter, APA family